MPSSVYYSGKAPAAMRRSNGKGYFRVGVRKEQFEKVTFKSRPGDAQKQQVKNRGYAFQVEETAGAKDFGDESLAIWRLREGR